MYTLPDIIKNTAQLSPEKIAFRFSNSEITYGQLLKKMNQLANLLLDLGIKKGDRVGILMPRCLETAVAIYGIMNAGAVYVPIDPKSPISRIVFLLKDCGIKQLISIPSQQNTIEQIISNDVPLQTIIGIKNKLSISTLSWEDVIQKPITLPQIRVLEQDLAYILYTSGSTGVPKGIMHTHYSGLAYAKLSAALYNLKPADIVGNHAPIYFDISAFGYFSAQLAGATTLIVPEAYTKMPASLSLLMEKEKISVWYSVPLALIQLLQNGAIKDRNINLRWVLFAGEPFPTKHLRQLMAQWPDTTFSNIYGPTETNQCTHYNLPKIPDSNDPIPIGSPWSNTEVLIIDEENNPVAKGEPGELLVRSATMMQGYWNRESLTSQSLLKKVIAPGFQSVFYKTGDLVCQNEEGNLLFLGRKDRQIKIRGFRVELDEITNVLMNYDAVDEAAVFTVKNEKQDIFISAAVIPKRDLQISNESLLEYLKKNLSSYAIPERICILDTFPRTASGKINIKELQASDQHSKTAPIH